MWDGLRMAVKVHLKHYGGDKHNKHDVHRAEKVQLDRIERINATWKANIDASEDRGEVVYIDLDL
jgi:hypothetical protein